MGQGREDDGKITEAEVAAFKDLLHTLEVEFAAVQLVGDSEVSHVARDVVSSTLDEYELRDDKDKFGKKREEVNKLLDQFISKARVSLEVAVPGSPNESVAAEGGRLRRPPAGQP